MIAFIYFIFYIGFHSDRKMSCLRTGLLNLS